jgi:hypothetical protein
MWGAIVIPSTSSGFAMEFIGDAHDSQFILNSGVNIAIGGQGEGTAPIALITGGTGGNIQTQGRGIN